MLDEIYSAQRVEYCRGKFLGCENNEVTKTVLTFMVKSGAGNYQDVVCLVPVNKISSELIDSHYQVIMKALWEIGF